MNNSRFDSLTFVESASQPLFQGRLRVHRRQSNRGTPFNLVILIDLAFIGLLFAILFTRLVTLPGMNIDFVKMFYILSKYFENVSTQLIIRYYIETSRKNSESIRYNSEEHHLNHLFYTFCQTLFLTISCLD